jgi:hypothetical protein
MLGLFFYGEKPLEMNSFLMKGHLGRGCCKWMIHQMEDIAAGLKRREPHVEHASIFQRNANTFKRMHLKSQSMPSLSVEMH